MRIFIIVSQEAGAVQYHVGHVLFDVTLGIAVVIKAGITALPPRGLWAKGQLHGT